MVPQIEVSDNVLKGLDQLEIPYKLRKESSGKQDLNDFVYIPSTGLYVAKQKTLHGRNRDECHEELQSQGSRMITVPEFVEFLNHLKSQANNQEYQDIYKDITEVRNSWRAEWLDADFKVFNRRLHVNSNHVYENEVVVTRNSKVLDKDTLMEDKLPGISLESWLTDKGHTKQGFPSKKVKSGDTYYWHPRSDNNSVVAFGGCSGRVFFNCDGDLSDGGDSDIGVRAVRHE